MAGTFPDAVLIPMSWRRGKTSNARVISLAEHADQILGVAIGEKSYGYIIIPMPAVMMWTRTPTDSYLLPKTHPRSGQQRYTWTEHEDGTSHGYLVPDAQPVEEIASDAV